MGPVTISEKVEILAEILHESGREAVARKLTHIKADQPFCEWSDLSEDAREGRRVMARYLLASGKVRLLVCVA
jgi:hypothetical protein